MNKLIKNFMRLIMIAIVVLTIGTNLSYAMQMDDTDTMMEKAKKWLDAGQTDGETLMPDSDVQGFVIPIARTLVAFATGVLTCVTIAMAIKYMMATPDQQAKLKQQLIGLVVSTIVIYGAQGIWALMYNFMDSVTK